MGLTDSALPLSQLLAGIAVRSLTGNADIAVRGLHYDSRRIEPGQAFVAIQGEQLDGNAFVDGALAHGATVIVSELPARAVDAVWVQVEDARQALALASAHWFGDPARRLRLAAITGTNGKTTTAFLTESLLRTAGLTTGLLGTIEYHVADQVLASPHTTPESYELQKLFRAMADAGCSAAVLEASSHALAMDRLYGCEFEVGVFTNLTQDHLDYHGTMERYLEAKRRLFQGTGGRPPRLAVVNADDPASEAMVAGFPGEVISYGFSSRAALRAFGLENSPAGVRFQMEGPGGWRARVASPLMGRVNVLNILAAIGAGIGMGLDREQILSGVAALTRVPGRFESVYEGQPFSVVVDYAHTPDALQNVLALCRELVGQQTQAGRVLCVFGCGGDRDRGKRPLMGEVAGRAADLVVLTSDNPRGEDPRLIINDALVGLQRASAQPLVEVERGRAIRRALEEAGPGDLVLIAGKGHETVQIVGEERHHFDDREQARAALRALGYAPAGV